MFTELARSLWVLFFLKSLQYAHSMSVLLYSHLLLASDTKVLENDGLENCDAKSIEWAKHILSGRPSLVFQEAVLPLKDTLNLKSALDNANIVDVLRNSILEKLCDNSEHLLLLAISLLQTFLQSNYTGPLPPRSSLYILLNGNTEQAEQINRLLIASLSSGGQQAYDLIDDPLSLVLSLLIFEKITNQTVLSENATDSNMAVPDIATLTSSGFSSVAHWWLGRALLVHLSLLPEPSGIIPSVLSVIFSSIDLAHAIANDLPEHSSQDVTLRIYTIFYLENVKCSLAINTEQLCLASLTKVKKLRKFEFVLTGARAKRTKFQRESHSGLIILAKSSDELFRENQSNIENVSPEEFHLESEILLEKPFFESIADEPLDEQVVKKQRLDVDAGIEEEKLLPLALCQENIPKELMLLDPNAQPKLADYDDIQLLLRFYVIRQSSPAKDPLVEEELKALISRVIYQEGVKNWTIYSRALWERSILETSKAKTVERGILQMQSLVEELGLRIESRLLPEGNINSHLRLSYIHQIPLLPRWELDAALAEKYMSLGVLRSAIEIYERLRMSCEIALCYAAVGDEKKAEEVLVKRIEENPNDARALSILGDIRQDPGLWEKSWKIGKYVNAKNSLARYFYNPPASSGLSRNYDATLEHLNDSLRQYPLSFDTWYFYGCVGLECDKMALATEAFSRCVSLDPTHALSWSNLSAAYVQLGKLKEAFSCLRKAVSSDAQKNWRIWENYMLVALKLNEWNDVLLACKKLVDIRRDKSGDGSIDVQIVEKLVEVLISSDYPTGDNQQLTHYQKSCTEFICVTLPSVITSDARCWRLVAKVELWRKRPWAALDCHEKAYRAISHNPDLEIDENVWSETVDACEDLIAAYESLGEIEGKFGPGSLVCKDWKYKSRATIKALMSKGKNRWDDSVGWERLLEMRNQ